ncbi:hypothetical protein GTP23_02905 [Pseudoduganella sp. FT93W]|uniref:Tetratricopeptide repeat protein n=1 Tax=Duganella fentianensis TaxID=2692177 RepID=A0A845HYN9_9BURK|nr:hypothetical protein [Duganella fentianensis]MYN44016.1 hypothetical protein [Duganella fentianensis]
MSRQIPNKAGLAAVVLAAAMVLSACGQRQALALPANAQQMASHIELALERDQFRAAVEMGEAFLQRHADPEGRIHRALVGAYLALGHAAPAARHMELAVAAGATAAPKAAPAILPQARVHDAE